MPTERRRLDIPALSKQLGPINAQGIKQAFDQPELNDRAGNLEDRATAAESLLDLQAQQLAMMPRLTEQQADPVNAPDGMIGFLMGEIAKLSSRIENLETQQA